MSAQAASLRIPFSTSHTQIGRCLSLLFQLYFSRLRCRRGTCFLDNAVVISPFFQVPLIWADMKTLHVYFFPQLATLKLSVQPLKPTSWGSFLSYLNRKVWLIVDFSLTLSSSCSDPPHIVSLKGLPVVLHTWHWLFLCRIKKSRDASNKHCVY